MGTLEEGVTAHTPLELHRRAGWNDADGRFRLPDESMTPDGRRPPHITVADPGNVSSFAGHHPKAVALYRQPQRSPRTCGRPRWPTSKPNAQGFAFSSNGNITITAEITPPALAERGMATAVHRVGIGPKGHRQSPPTTA